MYILNQGAIALLATIPNRLDEFHYTLSKGETTIARRTGSCSLLNLELDVGSNTNTLLKIQFPARLIKLFTQWYQHRLIELYKCIYI